MSRDISGMPQMPFRIRPACCLKITAQEPMLFFWSTTTRTASPASPGSAPASSRRSSTRRLIRISPSWPGPTAQRKDFPTSTPGYSSTSLPACASWRQPPHRSAGHRPCQGDTHIALPHGMPRGTSLSAVSLAGHHPPAATPPPGPSRRQGQRAVRRRSASGPGEEPSTRLGKSRTWHC